jgi:uncharacterized protein YbjQ (UPF0145 family)
MMNALTRFLVAALAAAGILAIAGCSTCNRPPIRPIDHACLPAGQSPADIPLLPGDVETDRVEIAKIDSFACKDLDADAVRRMMEDLKAKARVAGADAVIRVQRLHNLREGFISNPNTPFPSVMQGEWKEYFFRGTAVKYTGR